MPFIFEPMGSLGYGIWYHCKLLQQCIMQPWSYVVIYNVLIKLLTIES